MQIFPKKIFLIFVCFIFYAHPKCIGQRNAIDPVKLPETALKFIPKGFTVLDTAMGDANTDSFKDMLVLLKTEGEDTVAMFSALQYKRPLLIFAGNAYGQYTLVARNDHVVYCAQCGGQFGDPYNGLKIDKGLITISHFGGTSDRWLNDITFQYSKPRNGWYLSKVVSENWSTYNQDKVTHIERTKKNFGNVSFAKYLGNKKYEISQRLVIVAFSGLAYKVLRDRKAQQVFQ